MTRIIVLLAMLLVMVAVAAPAFAVIHEWWRHTAVVEVTGQSTPMGS